MALPAIATVAKGLLGSAAKKKTASDMAQDAVSNYTNRNKESQKSVKKPTKTEETTTSLSYSYKKPKTPKIKIPKIKSPSLKKSLTSLQKSLSGIVKGLGSLLKQKEKGDKEKKNRRRKIDKSLKEKGIEKIAGVYRISKNIAKKIPFIDRIKKFFVNVLLGSIVAFLMKNIDSIIETIEGVVEKIKEVFNLLNKYVFTPVYKMGEFIVKTIWPIIEGIMKLPPVDGAIKEIEKFMGEFEDLIPGFESAKTKLERKKAELEGKTPPSSDGSTPSPQPSTEPSSGSRQYDTSSGGLLAPGAVEQGEKAKEQVSQAGFGESEFALYRDVVAQIESGGEYDIQGGTDDMYSGRYQMGAAARENAARFLGETYEGDTEAARKKFREDPEMQERYFAAYTRANHETLMRLSPEYRELTKEGKLQVLGYAHNAGAGNAVDWLKSGRSESFRDGFNTRSDKYSTSIRKAQERRRRSVPPSEQPRGVPGVIPLQSKLPALPPTGTGSYAAAQQYGAPRDGGNRRHAGQDFDAGPNGTFYSRIGGEVIYSGNAGGGYGNVVDVYNKELGYTERVAEGDSNLVRKGQIVAPGTPLQRGTRQTGVFHYEIRKGRAGTSGSFAGTVNPIEFLKNLDRMVRQRQEQEQSKPPSENPPGVQPTSSQPNVSRSASRPSPTQSEKPNPNLYELLTKPIGSVENAMNTDNLQYSSNDVEMDRPMSDSVARGVSKKASYEGQKVIAMFSLPTPQNNSTGVIASKPSMSMSSGSSPQSNSNTYYKTLTIRNQYST